MKMALITLASALVAAGCGHGEGPSNRTSASAVEPAHAEISSGQAVDPDDVERVPVDVARRLVQNDEATLVCAYAGEDRFRQAALDGAISYEAFEEQLPSLSHQREIIFYCG